MAAYVREHMPPELVAEFLFAVIEGKDAVMVRDERCTSSGGRRVEHREGGPVPDMQTRLAAFTKLYHAGYGMPAQQVVIDAQVKQQTLVALAGVGPEQVDQLDVGAQSRMLAAIEAALQSRAGATDAEFRSLPVGSPEGGQESDPVTEGSEGSISSH